MARQTKKMRVLMVGVGGFGGYRRDRMRETGLFEIAAAYDRNPQALEACAAQDGARPAKSFEELLETPNVEALVISTGGKFHAAQALAGLKHRLHIFVEKPLCSTPAEVQALLAMQRKTGLVAGVGHGDLLHDPAALHLRKLLASGFFGKAATFEMVTAHSGGLEIKPGDWRGDPRKNPGGMLFQCGVHALHELLFLFGPLSAVSAVMRYDVHSTKTADVAHCLLRFRSGMVGTLSAYHVTPYRHTFNIYGTQRSLYIDRRAPSYGDASYIATQERKCGAAEPHRPFKLGLGKADICGNLKSFYRAVRQGGEPYPSLRDGARAVQAVFAAEESARTGRAVDVVRV
ncbi:MAG: Gfo/Idh/MocA family oxidoreductase [Planctomycetota bacterium]